METKQLSKKLNDLELLLDYLIFTVMHIMRRSIKMDATVEELTAEMELTKTNASAEKVEVEAAIGVLNEKISKLEAGIGGVPVGSVVTQTQLNSLMSLAKEANAAIVGVYNAAGVTPVADPYPPVL